MRKLTLQQEHYLKWLQTADQDRTQDLVLWCWRNRHRFMGDHAWDCFKMHAQFLRFIRVFQTASTDLQKEYVIKRWPDEC